MCICVNAFLEEKKWRHNIKHDDTQYNDTQHNNKKKSL